MSSSSGIIASHFFRKNVPARAEAEHPIQFRFPLPGLHQAFGLEPFEVGQVAQGSEAERLEEFPRRHIRKRRAGLRGADGAVDQAVAFERGNDVAADLASRELRNLPPCDRLQISDRGQRKGSALVSSPIASPARPGWTARIAGAKRVLVRSA